MTNDTFQRSEAELAAIGAFVLEALHVNHKLEKLMASVADLTAKLTAALPVLDAIKTDVDALKTPTNAPADLEAAVTGITDKITALRADVPTAGTGTPPPAGGALPGA